MSTKKWTHFVNGQFEVFPNAKFKLLSQCNYVLNTVTFDNNINIESILVLAKMTKEKETREKIICKYLANPLASKRSIAKHLKLSNVTVSRVIKRFLETRTIERKPGSGRKVGLMNPSLARKVINHVRRKPNDSLRHLASKFGMSHHWVSKVLQRHGLHTYKVQKHANRNDAQCQSAKTRSRRLYDNFLRGKNTCIVMDDETYVIADFKQLPGMGFYRSFKRFAVKKQFKYKALSKFPQKYMVWAAICSCGLRSRSYIAKGTMKSETYIKECLNDRLLPFIEAHDRPVLFWPDLASIHYAKSAMEWYESHKITIVPKIANPPNTPHLRPIERYWAIMKQKLRESGKIAKNYQSFALLWSHVTKMIPNDLVTRLMAHLPTKVREFARQAINE